MPSPREPEPEPTWPADEMEMEIDMSDDDEFEFDAIEDSADDVIEQRARSASNVPIWRLIEMSREDRFLKRELADFEDYDNYDRFTDDFAGLSH